MRRVRLAFFALLGFASAVNLAAASPVGDLQHLLNNAGYNAGAETGEWSEGTAKALSDFAAAYGMDVPDGKPGDAAVATIVAGASAKLDAAYAAYPTGKLPSGYFVGVGSQWYFNIHAWGTAALVNRNGTFMRVPIKRFFQPLEDDIEKYKAAGVNVVRMMLGMDGALFFDECEYKVDGPGAMFDACYARAYAAARKEKWVKQTEMLDHLSDNPVVKLFADGVAYWNENGFHVLVVPNDFFNGAGSTFDGSGPAASGDPLLHAVLANDPAFQQFFPRFVAAVVAELKRRKLTNISVQTVNEPRYCGPNGKPIANGLKKWQTEERAIFDEVRKVAPRISLVSAAICTSGDQFFSLGRPYSDIGQLMPIHTDLEDVTYSIHVYSPRALMLAAAQNALYKEGTVFHYPFKPIPAAAGRNKEAQFNIQIYNRAKPDSAYFEKLFAEVEAFATANSIHVIVDELNPPKPNYGIPREERVGLIADLVASSQRHAVPIVYFDTLGQWGLSSCVHSVFIADHRFDPAIMNLIAYGNGVAGVDPKAPIEPIEVQCGRPVTIVTTEAISNKPKDSQEANSLFATKIKGAKAGEDTLAFGISGRYESSLKNFREMSIVIDEPTLGHQVPEGLLSCRTVQKNYDPDDKVYRLEVKFSGSAGKLYATDVDCLIKNAPPKVAYQVKFLTTRLKDIAVDMVGSGNAEVIENDNLRAWMMDVASGAIVVGATPN